MVMEIQVPHLFCIESFLNTPELLLQAYYNESECMRMRINCTALCTETTTVKIRQIDIEPVTSTQLHYKTTLVISLLGHRRLHAAWSSLRFTAQHSRTQR